MHRFGRRERQWRASERGWEREGGRGFLDRSKGAAVTADGRTHQQYVVDCKNSEWPITTLPLKSCRCRRALSGASLPLVPRLPLLSLRRRRRRRLSVSVVLRTSLGARVSERAEKSPLGFGQEEAGYAAPPRCAGWGSRKGQCETFRAQTTPRRTTDHFTLSRGAESDSFRDVE